MKNVSHKQLAHYLINRYLKHTPSRYKRAFIMGCLEPDKNPSTYLKGSIRYQFLRGHNWSNTRRYIYKIAHRLENKPALKIVDYFLLGRMIHYLSDAFTYAHNATFGVDLQMHRAYEWELMYALNAYLQTHGIPDFIMNESLSALIHQMHSNYLRETKCLQSDVYYIVHVCCIVMSCLFDTVNFDYLMTGYDKIFLAKHRRI